ncbi:MAG: ankyrin repeat domain-containing protein [Parachlamydiales bacterium]|jgi:hypothetical protein
MQPISSEQNNYFDPSALKAAKTGDLSIVQKFIERGGWIDMSDPKGNSMLYYAAKKGQRAVVQYLLKAGAHPYTNLKGQTIQDVAVSQVEDIVKKLKNHARDELIESKAANIEDYDEMIRFIKTLPTKQGCHAFLNYARHLALFGSPDALSNFDHSIEGLTRANLAQTQIEAYLNCGDIESARRCIEKIPATDFARKLHTRQIDIAVTLLKELDAQMLQYPDDFKQNIKEGIDTLTFHMLKKVSKENMEFVLETLSSSGSFKSALLHANQLEDTFLKGFARAVLCYSGLDGLPKKALKTAHKEWEKLFQTEMEKVKVLLSQATKTNDFSEALVFIQTIEHPEVRQVAFTKVAYNMCSAGQYENAYQLLKIEQEGAPQAKYEFFSAMRLEGLIKMLKNEKAEAEWATLFSTLLNTQVS